jgi:hypothetical protein
MRILLSLVFLVAIATSVFAQGTAPGTGQVANPLRPSAQPGQSQAAPPAQDAPAAGRPKRERSEAQKRNDAIMRACGQEWRANKPALQARGLTWITFSKDCRAKRRTQTGI